MTRTYRWKWTAAIEKETLNNLQEIAVILGYIANVPGGKFGKPSPAGMLDALAAVYRADPEGVIDSLEALGMARRDDNPA